MKVLYANVLYDYNDKKRGWGLDVYTMLPSMKNIPGIEVITFDCSDFGDPELKKKNNAELIALVLKEKPDVMFHSAFTDQVTNETFRFIKDKTPTVTMNWFCDDQWRFDSFTKDFCWNFDYAITVDRDAIKRYNDIGYKNVILSQWATNLSHYPKLDLPLKYDVSFVGQPHGDRRETIANIKQHGIKIEAFGYGWAEVGFKKRWNKRFKDVPWLQFNKGKISHEDMIKVFNQSKINLNLSNSSDANRTQQMKARNFEVPSCGGLLLTGIVPYLEEYYEIGKEIVVYKDHADMLDKIRYYLSHEEERKNIADAGYRRTVKDHTYENRFKSIFESIKLKK